MILPFLVHFVAVLIQRATAATWTTTLAPLAGFAQFWGSWAAFGAVFELLWLLPFDFLRELAIQMRQVFQQVRMKNGDSAWSRAELSAEERRLLMELRNSRELAELLEIYPSLLKRADDEMQRRNPPRLQSCLMARIWKAILDLDG